MALLHHSFTKMSVGEADFHAPLGAPQWGACGTVPKIKRLGSLFLSEFYIKPKDF
jgi:hypothetical protein